LGADDFAGNFAVAVDDVSFGDHGGAVVVLDFLHCGIGVGYETYLLIQEELFVGGMVVVDAYAQDHPVARGDVLFEVVEGGGFFDAGWAPASPEIQDDDLAVEVGEAGGLAGEVEREILGGLAGDGGFALAVAGQGEGHDYGGYYGQGDPVYEFSTDCHRVIY